MEYGLLKINHLAVRLGFESKRPELVEGRMANYDTVSVGGGTIFWLNWGITEYTYGKA
jgi:hypothetical protein